MLKLTNKDRLILQIVECDDFLLILALKVQTDYNSIAKTQI